MLSGMITHASKIFLAPSRFGFKPTYYNYLLTASPGVGAAVIPAWLFTRYLFGLAPYGVSLASLAFPTATIIAVESRDIPLLLGGHFLKRSTRRSSIASIAGYILIVGGILIFSLNMQTSLRSLAGLLAFAGSILALIGSGLLRSLLQGVRGGIVPRYMASYSAIHLATAFSWLAVGSILMYIYPWLLGLAINPRDLIIHSISLGFIFNTIFGVDAVLMYSHMGISLRRAPRPSYMPYLLLNASIILRAAYDLLGFTGVTLISAPLTGLSIIIFFALHNLRLARLRRELNQLAS